VERTEDFIRRFRYQANKASLVQSRIKQLEKVERIVLPPERKRIRFQFPEGPKSGKTVMELKGLTKSYGSHTVLDRIDFTPRRGSASPWWGTTGRQIDPHGGVAGGEYQGRADRGTMW